MAWLIDWLLIDRLQLVVCAATSFPDPKVFPVSKDNRPVIDQIMQFVSRIRGFQVLQDLSLASQFWNIVTTPVSSRKIKTQNRKANAT